MQFLLSSAEMYHLSSASFYEISEDCLSPRAASQADVLACPFGGVVCRWHTVNADRSGAKTKNPAALLRYKFDAP